MKFLKFLSLIALVFVSIVAIGYYYLSTLINPHEIVLYIDKGDVEIDQGSGWESAFNGISLKELNSIKTGLNTIASIVFYDGIIIDLYDNTVIQIKSLLNKKIRLKESAGQSWNKFSNLAGINTFQIETPSTVATVRGTYFGQYLDKVLVGDGLVDAQAGNTLFQLERGEKIERVNNVYIEGTMTREDWRELSAKRARTLEVLTQVRNNKIKDLMNVFDAVFEYILKEYGYTEEDFWNMIHKVDRGERNIDRIFYHPVIKILPLDKIIQLTREIQDEHEILSIYKRTYLRMK